MPYTINLGSVRIENCERCIVIEKRTVFKIGENERDGQLTASFQIHNADGAKLAVISKNRVVYAQSGFVFKREGNSSLVKDTHGKIYAKVTEDPTTGEVTVVGDFWMEGCHVEISQANGIFVHNTQSGVQDLTIHGAGTAVSFSAEKGMRLG